MAEPDELRPRLAAGVRRLTYSGQEEELVASMLRDTDKLSRIWDENPQIIRAFIEKQPQYEQLCSEIAYILTKRLKDGNIEYSAITNRAKTLKSFAEKLTRKHYEDPLNDITDLAGVRVVYLYKSDRAVIEKLIESNFEVIEKVDKVEEQDADRFGYGALHYLVRLGRKTSGARYEDLKGLICEIQVRTVLQDAWAIIDHHLSYKQESDVPKFLRRKLNSLSGLFETADDQFERVRAEREEYIRRIKIKLSSKDVVLNQEMNLDTFTEYLKLKFPDKTLGGDDDHLSRVLAAAIEHGYTSFSDIEKLLQRTNKARETINSEKRTSYAAGEVARAIGLEQPDFRVSGWSATSRELLEKYEHLLTQIDV